MHGRGRVWQEKRPLKRAVPHPTGMYSCLTSEQWNRVGINYFIERLAVTINIQINLVKIIKCEKQQKEKKTTRNSKVAMISHCSHIYLSTNGLWNISQKRCLKLNIQSKSQQNSCRHSSCASRKCQCSGRTDTLPGSVTP